jgi:hypothetical protein
MSQSIAVDVVERDRTPAGAIQSESPGTWILGSMHQTTGIESRNSTGFFQDPSVKAAQAIGKRDSQLHRVEPSEVEFAA